MARMTSSRSGEVEETEGDLALLGNSLVYLRLVTERIQAAMVVLPHQSLLAPAVEDLCLASHLIRSVQERVSMRLVSTPPLLDFSEFSSEKNHKVHHSASCRVGCQKKAGRS